MDYIKIRFGSDFDLSDTDDERPADELLHTLNPLYTLGERCWKPQIDIYETNEEIIILGEISGVDKDSLDVEVSTKSVKISGYRPQLFTDPDAKYRLAEIQYGRFERTLSLPMPIDTDIVTASCSGGILQIRIAKQHMGTLHKIPISGD